MTSSACLLLAGDIGATKTALALYRTWPGQPLRQQTLQNRAFSSFDALVLDFLDQDETAQVRACFGVAGPVMAGAVHMTNLNWTLDAQTLQQRFGFLRVDLINDLVATAIGALHLPPADLRVLQPGEQHAGGAMAVLAPGSGLGEAFLVPHNGGYLPCPSEGGHVSFAPRDGLQSDLLAFMRARQAHVSVEQVCSGLALPELFSFIAAREPTPDWLQAHLEQADVPTPVIVQAGLAAVQGGRPCDVAVLTLRLFLDILADEAANLALKTLALGGVFLGGGLTPRLLPLLDQQRFLSVFTRGTYRDWLARIPIRIILNPQTALLGAAAHAADALGTRS